MADPQIFIDAFDDYQRLEDENLNVLGEFVSANGSGQNWYGDIFTNVRSFDYSSRFSFPNLVEGSLAHVQCDFLGRSDRQSRVEISIDGNEFDKSMTSVVISNGEATYGRVVRISEDFPMSSVNPSVLIDYPFPSGADISEGWLDQITITALRKLRLEGGQMSFRSKESLLVERAEYELSNLKDESKIWDVSDLALEQQFVLSGSDAKFTQASENLKEFVVFNPSVSQRTPEAFGQVENQNLHSLAEVDMLVIYHGAFEEQALRLAQHRATNNNLKIEAVEIQKVFNEFSSGMRDPTAIRDMAKMLYERYSGFEYLLLFGDGSYDMRGIKTDLVDQNFIPVYETKESLYPIDAFPSDDYYALLDDDEGDILKGLLDIAVGRIPARTSAEAKIIVDKIVRYDTEESQKGDWRLRVGFIADDEDTNTHIDDAEGIANLTENNHEWLNFEKIYLDSYEQLSTPGGQRYPEVTEAIDANIFKGMLVTNYIGHGGNTGWAQERILAVNDIRSWQN